MMLKKMHSVKLYLLRKYGTARAPLIATVCNEGGFALVRPAGVEKIKEKSEKRQEILKRRTTVGKQRGLSSFLIILCYLLLLLSCENPATSNDSKFIIPAGKGSFSLTLSQDRTVLPATPSLDDFAFYNLDFLPTGDGTAVNVDRTNENLSDPINLDPGTYNLVVNASKDSGLIQSVAMARGTLDGIVITAGQNTTMSVTLEALSSEGTGTFSWAITVPQDVTNASMKIAPTNAGGSNEQTVTLIPNNYTGSRTLNSGQYNLTINLESPNGQVIWKELLYVYKNLNSPLTFSFSNSYFINTNYTVTYESNGGSNVGEQSVLHGNIVSAPAAPTKSGFAFDGWYTDTAFANVWDFSDAVIGNITLYAKWDSDFRTEGLFFTLINNGIAYSVSKGTATAAEVVIPSFFEGKPVTHIADNGFINYSNMTSISIPANITSVGYNAFSNTGLTSVTIPASVTFIGDYAFDYCTSLTNITVATSNSNYSSEGGILYNKAKTNLIQAPSRRSGAVTISSSVTSIGEVAFARCYGLTAITIPASVTIIGHAAFDYCTSLTSVTFATGSAITFANFGNNAFPEGNNGEGGNSLRTVYNNASIKAGIYTRTSSSATTWTKQGSGNDGTPGLTYELINNSTAYRVRKGTVTSGAVVIPASYNGLPVTEIGSVNDSSSNGAFYYTSITSVTIPASITSIGSNAFSACSGLTAITVDSSNTNYASEGGILYNKAKTVIVAVPQKISGHVTIPSSVTSVSDNAFQYCTSLTSITISSSVTSIGDWAFYGCTGLTVITIPANVRSIGEWAFGTSMLDYPMAIVTVIFTADSQLTSIGDSAFTLCASLTNITIPASVTTIGERAFNYCTSLISITIPASVTTIGETAFASCNNLTSVTFATGSNITSFGSYAFPTQSGYVSDNLKTEYLAGGAGTYTKDSNGWWTKQSIPVSFNSLSNDGSSTQTTTQLTLTFSQTITGLSTDDIYLDGVSGVITETLSGSGPTYTLGISGFTAGGTLNVSVYKTGYAISNSSRNTTIYYYRAPGFVREVFFTDSTTTVALNNLYGNDIYLVKINTSDLAVSSSNIGGAANIVSMNSSVNSIDFAYPIKDHIQEFNANPPPIIEEALRRQRAAFVPPVVGDTRSYWVETYYHSETWVQKQATLLATGTHGNIWVMNENITSGTSSNKISTSQAQEMAAKFDLLYPLTTNIFGYEYGGGPNGDGGMDGDKKIQILVYDFVDAFGNKPEVSGFFWAKDFYNYSTQKSNLAEIFYFDASTVIKNPDFTYSALIHEFQHMINFNRKYVEHRNPLTGVGLTSAAWYTEMLSMLAEDVIAPLIGIAPTNSGHVINRYIPRFRNSYYNVGITEWNDDGASYPTKYAFGAYLIRNYGGPELLRKIINNDKTDVESITLALQEVSAGMDFIKALKRYGEAMIFSGSSIPEGVFTFDKTVTSTINGQTYTANRFDIWGGNGLSVNPSIAEMRPHSIIVQQANEWKNLTGSLSITLNRPSDPNVVLYLMVK